LEDQEETSREEEEKVGTNIGSSRKRRWKEYKKRGGRAGKGKKGKKTIT